MLFLTNDAPDAAAAVSEAASAVSAALEDGTASTVGFFQKIFGNFSWTKLISAAILLVVCGVLIKLILKATDRMLGRSRLDKAVHPFVRAIVRWCCCLWRSCWWQGRWAWIRLPCWQF